MDSVKNNLEWILNNEAINDEFFNEIVSKILGIPSNSFKIHASLLYPATGKNENFVSVLMRAKIKIEIVNSKSIQTCNLILKASNFTEKNFKDLSVFTRERFIYENILENFETIWLEHAETIQFGPKCLKAMNEPLEIIALQDLSTENFEIVDRKTGFDLRQSQIILRKLAKFHAAGAVYHQQVFKRSLLLFIQID